MIRQTTDPQRLRHTPMKTGPDSEVVDATPPTFIARALAAFLSVPVKTLRDWRYTGVGPSGFRVGRHVRYEPAEVRRWLVEDCTRGARTV